MKIFWSMCRCVPGGDWVAVAYSSKKETIMNSKNISIRWMTLTALGIALVFFFGARTEPAQAYEDPNEKPFPMVGLAKGQTARLNMVNIGDPNLNPCEVQMVFYDSQGKALARDVQRLDPGMATFLDLSYAAVGNPNIRVQIRAWVKVIGDPTLCLASLEVFDDETGKTAVFIGDPHIK